MTTSAAKCPHCGADATCLGCYEDAHVFMFACDKCCLHGCEDGKCYPVDTLDAVLNEAFAQIESDHNELKRLREEVSGLRDQVRDAYAALPAGPGTLAERIAATLGVALVALDMAEDVVEIGAKR